LRRVWTTERLCARYRPYDEEYGNKRECAGNQNPGRAGTAALVTPVAAGRNFVPDRLAELGCCGRRASGFIVTPQRRSGGIATCDFLASNAVIYRITQLLRGRG
jgi:hypothetical protein